MYKRQIEGYDISQIQGSDAVASQVVFIDGLPAKQHYRKYKIRSSSIRAGHSDDFMAMAEIMRRRFRRWARAKAEGGCGCPASQRWQRSADQRPQRLA